MGLFDKQVVIVTGASSGIGASAAILFAKEGAYITLVGRNETRLQKTKEECKKAGCEKLLTLSADISNASNLSMIVDKTIEEFGQLNVLVNNAGSLSMEPMGQLSEKEFSDQVNINMKAPVFLSQYALPHLEKTKGNIVNVGSVSGKIASPESVIYGMTKAAIDHFCISLSMVCAPKGVRVNNVNPGVVVTGIVDKFFTDEESMKQSMDFQKKIQPLGLIEACDIAEAILFLASPKSHYITGVTLPVDAGRTHTKVIV